MKKFVSGMLVGTILTASMSVFAAGGKTIEVFENVKRIVVNKVEKKIDPQSKPFAYNGTTYVPLRFVADSLGVQVGWDGPTGTIFIGETDNTEAKYWVTDLPSINYTGNMENGHGNPNKKIVDNMGNQYSNYLSIWGRKSEIGFSEYGLNGQFKTFKAKLGIPKEYQNVAGDRIVRIYLDEKVMYEKVLTAGALLTDINLDVTGVMKIRFELECEKSNFQRIGFFDGEFLK